MGFKRAHSNSSTPSSPRSNCSSSDLDKSPVATGLTKKPRDSTSNDLVNVKIHIVQAKLDGALVAELITLAEDAGASLCASPDDSDVLVTSIGMRRRLERHLNWKVAREKAVVTVDWLRDSVAAGRALPCGDYVALEDLRDETIIHCPESNNCSGCQNCRDNSSAPSTLPSTAPKPVSASHCKGSEEGSSTHELPSPPTPPELSPSTGVDLSATLRSTATEKLDHTSRYACARATPLFCPNQELARELSIIRRSRELEGEHRSALSYQRAIGVIKAHPRPITSIHQVEKLPYIGAKIGSMVEEFLDSGCIATARKIAQSERFHALSVFTDVYGIGPVTARKLYNLGLRTIEDLRVFYDVDKDSELDPPSQSQYDDDDGGDAEDVDGREVTSSRRDIQVIDDESLGIKVGLAIYHELLIKIPRDEVEEMARIVYAELCQIQPGCAYTVVGGYRRGKQESSDVDIVFTHLEPGKDRGLCKKLVRRLRGKGMITHVMHLSSFRSPTALRKAHWDTLEKALTVFRLPRSSPHFKDNGSGRALCRRLDLIFAPVEVYWCAVIGWSGSTMFQRDIRQWTKDKRGWKFDSSGITRLSDSSLVLAKSELEVFEMCGLEWIDPTMRNADV